MPENFDPYHLWLGIPAGEQPPHHYRLLGIPPFEEDPTVIENAADQRMAHLRTFQAGKHAAQSQRLLNEVATAKLCLLNPEKKTMYDQLLRPRLFPTSGSAAAALDPGLVTLFEKPRSAAAAITAVGRGKKSQSNSMMLITVVAHRGGGWILALGDICA